MIKIERLKPGRKWTREKTPFIIYQNNVMKYRSLMKRGRISEKDFKKQMLIEKINKYNRIIEELKNG